MSAPPDEKISVLSYYNRDNGIVMPWKVKLNHQVYQITKLGFHHTVREGRTLFHIFSVATDTLFFRLKLDTETLHWTVEEVDEIV